MAEVREASKPIKKQLTDPFIRSLKPAAKGKRYSVSDQLVPGLKVRVTETGTKTFILWKRFDGAANPSARALGEVGVISLANARAKASAWITMLKCGEDPREVERAARSAEVERRGLTFAVVVAEFLEQHVKGQRKTGVIKSYVERELLPRWGSKQIGEITRRDVVLMTHEIKARAPAQARNILGTVRVFFNWAINLGIYGIEQSPCDRLKVSNLIGPKLPRQRVLNDAELCALWAATAKLGYPFGSMVRMLLLSAQRKSEVAEAPWEEFNLKSGVWTIPAGRMKSDAAQIVPISTGMRELLSGLPRWANGDFLFSCTDGRAPIIGLGKPKARLDALMLEELRRAAEERGDDPRKVRLEPFVLHDLRRTVRTRLSGLRVPEPVCEMILAHARKGLARIYDQHRFQDEMAEALEAWSARLRSIVDPPPANVVPLRARRGGG